ncbi:hypothetical protein JCM19055_2927 [Geomicrobium sp. JCM 19055]|nr:hypothetical protein JCM19055_2927 [Geomicrobium sp. JCM 19055]
MISKKHIFLVFLAFILPLYNQYLDFSSPYLLTVFEKSAVIAFHLTQTFSNLFSR